MGARPESTGRKTLLGPAALGAYSVEQFYVPQDELITLAAWKKEQAEAAQRVPKLTAADLARLDSWMTELAAQVQGAGREEASGDWRFGSNDALVIHPHGFWHNFAGGDSGHGALSLLAHLHGGEEAGTRVAVAWLAQHAGKGVLLPATRRLRLTRTRRRRSSTPRTRPISLRSSCGPSRSRRALRPWPISPPAN